MSPHRQGSKPFLNCYRAFRTNVIYSRCWRIAVPDSRRPDHDVQPSATHPSLTPSQKQAVLEELRRVLDSVAFHSSPRCQEFLRYIVEHSVEGSAEHLKERNIGIDVFHRSPAYEPNTDAIVRVRATEVRKRLAQHYGQAPAASGVRIELVAGSYVPEFRWTPEESAPTAAAETLAPSAPIPVRKWRPYIWAAAPAAIVLVASVFGLFYRTPSTPLRDFWQPSLNSANPVVICLGQPVVYHLSRRVHERHLKTLPPNRIPGPYIIPLKPGDIEASDVLPVPDQYVGAGSAQAAARISALLAGWKKPTQMRIGNEISFYDLRNYPAVLEGAFSNDWTMKMSQQMPFVFIQENGVRGIREKSAPANAWYLRALESTGKTAEDYAVAGRVFDSGTLEPLVFVAGITQYGTQAAGEFIANEEAFAAAMANAPKDWRTRNLQILLHLNVIGKIPGKPEVLAVRTW